MKEDDPLAWVEKAEEDWDAANILVKQKKTYKGIICFHFQQCAEKYIKAILVSKETPFPKTHDLIVLSKICENAGVLLGMDEDALDVLSGYAATARYPGAEPSLEDVHESQKTAQTVRKFARTYLGLK